MGFGQMFRNIVNFVVGVVILFVIGFVALFAFGMWATEQGSTVSPGDFAGPSADHYCLDIWQKQGWHVPTDYYRVDAANPRATLDEVVWSYRDYRDVYGPDSEIRLKYVSVGEDGRSEVVLVERGEALPADVNALAAKVPGLEKP